VSISIITLGKFLYLKLFICLCLLLKNNNYPSDHVSLHSFLNTYKKKIVGVNANLNFELALRGSVNIIFGGV
jgi:hypothetical protein